jgi:hypothetical protein
VGDASDGPRDEAFRPEQQQEFVMSSARLTKRVVVPGLMVLSFLVGCNGSSQSASSDASRVGSMAGQELGSRKGGYLGSTVGEIFGRRAGEAAGSKVDEANAQPAGAKVQ